MNNNSTFDDVRRQIEGLGAERVDILMALVPACPAEILPDMVCLAVGFYDNPQQNELLQLLAERIKQESEVVQRKTLVALRSLDALSDLGAAADFVTQLILHVEKTVLPWCAETALHAGDPTSRMPLMIALCQRICPENLSRYLRYQLDQISSQQKDENGAWFWDEAMLLGIASGVPTDLRDEVAEVTRTLKGHSTRAIVLLHLGASWGNSALSVLSPEALSQWKDRGDESISVPLSIADLIKKLPSPWYDQWRDQLASEILSADIRSSDDDFSRREIERECWPLLNADEQQQLIERYFALALQSPVTGVNPSIYASAREIFSPRLEVLAHLPGLTDDMMEEALKIASSLHDKKLQLRALEHFIHLASSKERVVEAYLSSLETLSPENQSSSSLISIIYDLEGELKEKVGRIALHIIHQLPVAEEPPQFTSEFDNADFQAESEWNRFTSPTREIHTVRGNELQRLGSYLPPSLMSELTQAILDLPEEMERRAVGEQLLRYIASAWPQGVHLLLKVVGSDEQGAFALSTSWRFLPQEVRQAVNSKLWRATLEALDLLQQPDISEEQRNYVTATIGQNFKILQPEQRSQVLRTITEFQFPLDEILLSWINDLPRNWQIYLARQALQEEATPAEWTDRVSYDLSLIPYLEPIEQQNYVGKWLQEIKSEGNARLNSLKEQSSDSEDSEESRWQLLSSWEDCFVNLRRLTYYAREDQLRDVIGWLKSLGDMIDLTGDEELSSRGNFRAKEQTLAVILLILARQVQDSIEAQELMTEALELAFYYPYYPELGGNGADPDPQGVEVTVGQIESVLNNLTSEDRDVMIRRLLEVVAEKNDTDELLSVSRRATQRDENLAYSEVSKEVPLPSDFYLPNQNLTATTAPLYLQGKLPAQSEFGQILRVRLRFAPQVGEFSARLKDVFEQKKSARLTLLLNAGDFEVIGKQFQELTVEPFSTSSWIEFEMRPRKYGRHSLTASAFQGSVHLGELTATVEIVDKISFTSDQSPEVTLMRQSVAEGEMTWRIRYDEVDHQFDFFFCEPGSGAWESRSMRLSAPLELMVEKLIENIELGEQSPSLQRPLLSGLGADIWTQCLPQDLQEILRSRFNTLRRIQIISDGGLPWELLYDTNSRTGSSTFLSEQLPIYRWIMGSQSSRDLTWNNPCFVSAESPEPSISAELQTVRRHIGAFREDAPKAVHTKELLLNSLERGNFDWLHFSGHHFFSPENPAQSSLRLGDGCFRAAYLSIMQNRWATHKPLIFLNACRTAGIAPGYTAADSWAFRCIDAGAAAFVGTFWEVGNHVSALFSDEFYKALAKQNTLVDAFFSAKLAARDAYPDDFSWLSYTVYGNADAIVRIQI